MNILKIQKYKHVKTMKLKKSAREIGKYRENKSMKMAKGIMNLQRGTRIKYFMAHKSLEDNNNNIINVITETTRK